MKSRHKLRRTVAALIILAGVVYSVFTQPGFFEPVVAPQSTPTIHDGIDSSASSAAKALQSLEQKGRAPKTGYTRDRFGDGWIMKNGCDTRNIILRRDLEDVAVNDACQVVSGTLSDPYTGVVVKFQRGPTTSDKVQIDHVVALSDAWQKGAQQLTTQQRVALANDPLELLAVDGQANQQKSDADAASWLPSYKPFRCQYVARQIAVKLKYHLWVTQGERTTMEQVLAACPGQTLPKE